MLFHWDEWFRFLTSEVCGVSLTPDCWRIRFVIVVSQNTKNAQLCPKKVPHNILDIISSWLSCSLCSCLMSSLPGVRTLDWSTHHLKYYQSSTFGKYPIFKMTWTTDLTINKSAIGLTIIGKRPINIKFSESKKNSLSWKCPLTKYFFCKRLKL